MTVHAGVVKLRWAERGMRMRAIGMGVLAMLALAGPAMAQGPDDGSFWAAPSDQAIKANWPHEADGRLVYGEVNLDCQVGLDGAATACTVITATSNDPRLAKAALAVAPLFKARNPQAPRTLIDIDQQYDQPSSFLKYEGDSKEIDALLKEPVAKGLSGTTVVECTAGIDGRLRNCSIIKDDNPGVGYGPASLAAAKGVRVNPAIRAGQAVESQVRMPYRWAPPPAKPGAQAAVAAASEPYDDDTHWTRPPHKTLIAKWPHDASGHLIYGQVKLDCEVGANGFATGCKVLSASPSDPSIVAAANALAPLFQARDRSFKRAVIDFDLRNDEPAEITDDPSDADFDAAYAANVRTKDAHGAATVECTALTDGHLRSCSVLNEYPRGLGFGAAVSTLVRTAKAKPATRQGKAVDSQIVLTYGWLADDGTYGPPPKN